MKIYGYVSIFLLSMIALPAFSQEKSRKELKDELKEEQQRLTDTLVSSGEFVFIGQTSYAQDGSPVNLTTRKNYVKYHPDCITAFLPYFGKSSGNVGIEGDVGLKFSGKPDTITIKNLKKGFLVSAVVKSEGDTYRLKLNVMHNAIATLSVSSYKKSTALYDGNIWSVHEAHIDN